jgi:hypothetical protein
MHSSRARRTAWFVSSCLALIVTGIAAQQGTVTSSYGPTNQRDTFDQIKAARMGAASRPTIRWSTSTSCCRFA